jgi:nucleoside-diphosphate-sugar epimerase
MPRGPDDHPQLTHRAARRIVVTGGYGFVATHLCRQLRPPAFRVVATVRQRAAAQRLPDWVDVQHTGDLACCNQWPTLLEGADAVVHLVARTHATRDSSPTALRTYQATNVVGTQRLADAAVRAGVRHFVYVSSIKAVADEGSEDLDEMTRCRPAGAYGMSKLAAEQLVLSRCRETCTTATILRPPLVYGPGVPGNFRRLLRLVARGLPVPAAANERSVIHVRNLAAAIRHCLARREDAAGIFHVADTTPVSTRRIVECMAAGMQRTARTWPLPRALLTALAACVGRSVDARRLAGSLRVSTAKIRAELGWTPRIDAPAGITDTARAFAHRPW